MSSVASRTTRARRGRVLVVGDAPAAARLSTMLVQPPTAVINMFEAIGEIACAGTQDVVAAIIIAQSLTIEPHELAISAARRVDPSVRIVGLTARTGESPIAMTTGGAGPDAWLDAALRTEDVRKALDDDGLLALVASNETAPASALSATIATVEPTPIAPPPPARTIIDLDAPVPQAPTATVNAANKSDAPPVDRAAAPAASMTMTTPSPQITTAPASPASAPTQAPIFASTPPAPQTTSTLEPPSTARTSAAPTPITAVGDTDLIHALLHTIEGVTPLALRLIAHHGGWNNVRFITDASTTDGVEVICDGKRFGKLLADRAEPGRLRAWADWLGHWLHIEREHHRLRHLANCDDLTGAWNRRFFDSFLADAIARARVERRSVTVMVFDIDNFKTYNDTFGHAAGDEILREMVRLLRSVVRQGDIVCRIGGDEFVVVFADPEAPRTPGSKHPESVESIARRFQRAVASMHFPKLGLEAHGSISISAGLATFPWDGQDAETLLQHADRLAMKSKRNGKNMITLGREMGERSAD